MARRNRRTPRPARRETAPERQTAATERPSTATQPAIATRQPARDLSRSRARGRPVVGLPRAVGAPSEALERAATLERGYVVKDIRRLAIVTAIMLALLAVSGFLVNALLP